MKDLMLEELESRTTHVEVSFLCPDCGHPAVAFLDIPREDHDLLEEINCLNNEEAHTSHVRILKSNDEFYATLDDGSGGHVSVRELPDEDDWDDLPPPVQGAYGIFLNAMEEWRINQSELASSDGKNSRNRMLFVTLFSILEAYLYDALLGAVAENSALQKRILQSKGLSEISVTLSDILNDPEIVQKNIAALLQRTSFHNLPKTHSLCELLFGDGILPRDGRERSLLIKAVTDRHDCVHRNGTDMNGTRTDGLTKNHLSNLARLFEVMAERLQDNIEKASPHQYPI